MSSDYILDSMKAEEGKLDGQKVKPSFRKGTCIACGYVGDAILSAGCFCPQCGSKLAVQIPSPNKVADRQESPAATRMARTRTRVQTRSARKRALDSKILLFVLIQIPIVFFLVYSLTAMGLFLSPFP